MDGFLQRIVLASLAIAPALALLAWPAQSLSVSWNAILGGAGSLYALLASIQRPRLRGTPRSMRLSLLRRRSLIRNKQLPSRDVMRSAIQKALSKASEPVIPGTPISRDAAVAAVLDRVIGLKRQRGVAALDPITLSELYMLHQVLIADKGETGRAAQLFRRPDLVLEIRREVDEIARKRALFDQGLKAFEASAQVWSEVIGHANPPSLVDQLRKMTAPDIDLWHHVVLNYDPICPDQRAAALWCVQNQDCDRATVAAFLARLAKGTHLVDSALADERAYLDDIYHVILTWNTGAYRTQELALSPTDVLVGTASEFSTMLDDISRMTKARRWPDPHGAFVAHTGRAARARPAWDLAKGGLSASPVVSDYVDMEMI